MLISMTHVRWCHGPRPLRVDKLTNWHDALLSMTSQYSLHCALSLAAQCIIIGPVCGRVCNGRAGGVGTLLQPACAQCLRLSERFFFHYVCVCADITLLPSIFQLPFLLLFILFPAGFRSPFLYGFSPQRKQIARQHLWSARKNFAHTLFHHHAIFGCFVLIFSAMCL